MVSLNLGIFVLFSTLFYQNSCRQFILREYYFDNSGDEHPSSPWNLYQVFGTSKHTFIGYYRCIPGTGCRTSSIYINYHGAFPIETGKCFGSTVSSFRYEVIELPEFNHFPLELSHYEIYSDTSNTCFGRDNIWDVPFYKLEIYNANCDANHHHYCVGNELYNVLYNSNQNCWLNYTLGEVTKVVVSDKVDICENTGSYVRYYSCSDFDKLNWDKHTPCGKEEVFVADPNVIGDNICVSKEEYRKNCKFSTTFKIPPIDSCFESPVFVDDTDDTEDTIVDTLKDDTEDTLEDDTEDTLEDDTTDNSSSSTTASSSLLYGAQISSTVIICVLLVVIILFLTVIIICLFINLQRQTKLLQIISENKSFELKESLK